MFQDLKFSNNVYILAIEYFAVVSGDGVLRDHCKMFISLDLSMLIAQVRDIP